MSSFLLQTAFYETTCLTAPSLGTTSVTPLSLPIPGLPNTCSVFPISSFFLQTAFYETTCLAALSLGLAAIALAASVDLFIGTAYRHVLRYLNIKISAPEKKNRVDCNLLLGLHEKRRARAG